MQVNEAIGTRESEIKRNILKERDLRAVKKTNILYKKSLRKKEIKNIKNKSLKMKK